MEALRVLPADARPPLLPGAICLWLRELNTPRDHAAAHQLLKIILSDYLGQPAATVPLQTGMGKAPCLNGNPDYALSLSYAGDFVAVGICKGRALGIDLVQTDCAADWPEVANTFLSPDRRACLGALSPSEQEAAFAGLWGEMEARGKCIGRGLQEYSPTRDNRLYHPDIRIAFAQDTPPGFLLAVATTTRTPLPG